jgi:predicted acylesterase/phospholipase RssA
MSKHQPVLGLALSGAAARSAFYVGFLEVLQEEQVQVKVIAAQSGASIVASAFACGSLPQLKDFVLSMDWKKIRPLLRRGLSEGALYSITPAVDHMRQHMTFGKRFEDLETRLVFAATNLNTGELVSLAMGDIARGIQATCAVPGLFAPVRWGNHLLIDGGLISAIPGRLAKQAGADVVIGVDAKSTRYIFLSSHITMKEWYNSLRDYVRGSVLARLWEVGRQGLSTEGVEMYVEDREVFEDIPRPTRMSYILSRSLDLASQSRTAAATEDPMHGCDYIISEGEGRFGDTAALNKTTQNYYDGRRAASANLDKIRGLLNDKN